MVAPPSYGSVSVPEGPRSAIWGLPGRLHVRGREAVSQVSSFLSSAHKQAETYVSNF